MSSIKCIAKHPTISLVESTTTLRQLTQIHAQLLLNGLLNHNHLLGQFIAAVAIHNPTHLTYATRILTHSDDPTRFAHNSLIRAYSKSSTPEKSLHFYKSVLLSSSAPDNFTLTFALRACAQLAALGAGSALHGSAIRRGLENDPHFQSGLIFMYAEAGCLGSSRRAFGSVAEPDVVCQTAMVSACARCGDLGFAREVFDEMPSRDPVAWNAMIAGYSQGGKPREALELFRSMQAEGVRVNEVAMVSVLSACSSLGALNQGRWAHAYVERSRLRVTVSLATALVDMYAKCGDVEKAMCVFWGARERNVCTWNSAMGGLAMNGFGERCLELFAVMKQERVKPNEVTFVAVLRGCCVVGLVSEGREHFRSMKEIYRMEPWVEHYGCMVDLYGRAGFLGKAMDIINSMPMKPHAGAWGALLNACKIHNNLELGKFASRKIVELEAKNHGAYVLLSNMYADSKNWDGVGNVRNTMRAKGVRKPPGCSVIEVGGEVHEFFVGDKSHPKYDEIEAMLGEISRRLRLFGYVANTNPVLFDIEEEEKEDALCRHSEKVAIAFGLISLREGIPIRIVKNLRICWDCHQAAKMISKFFDREIIVRDRNRFHHFQDGDCSCKGYW